MTLHYSVRYKDDSIAYHGEVNFPANVSGNHKPYLDSMIMLIRTHLLRRQNALGKGSADMVKAEFYFHKTNEYGVEIGEETVFFKWEKEEEE